MRTILLHNPSAGSGDHTKADLISALRLRDWSIDYFSTKKHELEDVLRRMAADLIIVAGGDGTVTKVVTRMPDRRIPVAILPLGTANNIARSLGVSGNPVELAECWSVGRYRRLNIGLARGPWGRRRFVEAVGLGPFAQTIEVADKEKSDGADGIRAGRCELRALLREAQPLDVEVLVDHRPVADSVVALEVLNIAYAGPALPLAPQADPGDGKLDIVSIAASQAMDIADWLKSPAQCTPLVNARQGLEVTIKGDLPTHRVDDDVFQPTAKGTITIELEPEPVRVIVPESSGAT
jgi:diacylglycerol kinase family enzyme